MFEYKEIKMLDEDAIIEMGKRIQDKRIEKGMKAIELAECVGIGHNQLSRIENGKVICKLEHLFIIAQCLDVSVDFLLYGKKEMQQFMEIEKMLEGITYMDLRKIKMMIEIIKMN